ncbi:MAG: hypothetical protein ABIT76_12460 [Chthoniobacterales bacterium]
MPTRHHLLTIALAALLTSPLLAVSNRSTSGSQQFTVTCADRSLRQNLAGAFDDVRRGLFTELGIQLGAPTQIDVNITPRKIVEYNASTWNMRWLDAPNGARVQLDILVDDDMREQRLQEHIVSALLLTIKYRDNPPVGGQMYSEAPAWLVEGLSEKIRLQTREPDAALYRGLLNGKSVPDLVSWMKVDPAKLDTTSLGIYRAYACSLLNYFLDEPGGNKKLTEFLQKAPTDSSGAIDWLAKAFPNMGAGGKNLPKWWSLSLAKLSSSDRYMAWSGQATNDALEKMLVVNFSQNGEAKKFTLDEYQDFLKLPESRPALAMLGNDLARLSIHAHPLFRPVVSGYQDVLDRMQRGKLKNLAGKLDELQQLRAQLHQRLQDVSDYLTWFEATQAAQQGPGEFDGYFRLMQTLHAARPPSREPIGRYLDAMEAELKN